MIRRDQPDMWPSQLRCHCHHRIHPASGDSKHHYCKALDSRDIPLVGTEATVRRLAIPHTQALSNLLDSNLLGRPGSDHNRQRQTERRGPHDRRYR